MLYRNAIGAISLALVLCGPIAGARAFDESKYPDFNGQWRRPPGIANQFDISKPQGRQPRPGIIHTSLYLPQAVYEGLREAAFRERCKSMT